MSNASTSQAHGSRTIPIAMILFGLLAVFVGLQDPTTSMSRTTSMTAQQAELAAADIKFGFAKQVPGEHVRVNPF